MNRQNQNQTVVPSQAEEQESKKERVKATFSVLDRVVKAYNEGETYVKRGITLFGLGSLIAGISFGAGQQVSQREVNTANDLNNSSTAEVQPTPQPVPNHPVSTPPPSVIYLTPMPSQHSVIPSHTPVPTPTTPTVSNSSVQPVPKPVPTPQPSKTTNSPVQPASNPTPQSQSSTITDSPEAEPVVSEPPVLERAGSVSSVLSDVQQAVEPFQQVSGILSGLKQTVEPWTEESDDD